MSAVIEHGVVPLQATPDRADQYAATVTQLARLAGRPLDHDRFESFALLLAREGILVCDGVTFGCDYRLNVRSRELRDGYVRALNRSLIATDGHCFTLSPHAQANPEAEPDEAVRDRAREILALSDDELRRHARYLLLSE